MLQRDAEPKMAVGESGLSTMSRAMQRVSLDLDLDIQSHVFALKSGLTFYDAVQLPVRSTLYGSCYAGALSSQRNRIEVKTACNAIAILPDGAAASSSTSMLHSDHGKCYAI